MNHTMKVFKSKNYAVIDLEGESGAVLNVHELRAKAREMLSVAEEIEPELPTREKILEALANLRIVIKFGTNTTDKQDMEHLRKSYSLLGGDLNSL